MKAKNSTILIALCAIMMLAAYNFDLLTRQVCYDCHIFLWTVLIYMTLSVKGKTFDALFETAYVLLYT